MRHLKLAERYEISILDKQGRSRAEIDKELKSNSDGRNRGCGPELAQRKVGSRHGEKNQHEAFMPGVRNLWAYRWDARPRKS